MKAGWEPRLLGELCDFQRGLIYSKADEVEAGGHIVLRATNIDLETGSLDFSELRYISDRVTVPQSKKVQQGSLLICTASGSRSHLGKVGFVDSDIDAAFGGFIGQITARKGLLPRYLFYVLRSQDYQQHLSRTAPGTNINNLKFDDIADLKLYLPPLPEQQRIVGILDEAFEGIATATANAERNLTNSRELFGSYIAALLDESDQWQTRPLGELCQNLDSQRRPITKSDRVAGSIPYYGASGVVDHVRDYLFDEPLLLVSEDGANLLMRTYPIAFSISGKSWVNNHAHVLRFKDDVLRRFIEYYLNSISLVSYINGMAQPKLNQKALNAIPIPIPPGDMVGELVHRLDVISEQSEILHRQCEGKVAALAELKKSLLARAFSGELTARDALAA